MAALPTPPQPFQNVLDALARAARLESLGITIRSAELREDAARLRHFNEHGNRKLRRAAQHASRRRGHGYTK